MCSAAALDTELAAQVLCVQQSCRAEAPGLETMVPKTMTRSSSSRTERQNISVITAAVHRHSERAGVQRGSCNFMGPRASALGHRR